MVSTTGEAGGSCLTASGERGGIATRRARCGSGEVEAPGVGSCECPSLAWDMDVTMGGTSGRD